MYAYAPMLWERDNKNVEADAVSSVADILEDEGNLRLANFRTEQIVVVVLQILVREVIPAMKDL